MTSSYIQRRYKIADSERNAVENARVIWLRRYCRSVGQSLLLNRHLVRVGPCCHALGAISSAGSVMVKFGFVIYTYYVYIYMDSTRNGSSIFLLVWLNKPYSYRWVSIRKTELQCVSNVFGRCNRAVAVTIFPFHWTYVHLMYWWPDIFCICII